MLELPPIPQSYRQLFDFQEYQRLRAIQEKEFLGNPHWDEFISLLEDFFPPDPSEIELTCSDWIQFSAAEPLQSELREEISPLLKKLIPWRKGPFRFFDIDVDSEWRSDSKWTRLEEHLATVRGKRVLDVGSNNGYYMYRMLPQDPDFVLGIDPSSRCYYQFLLLQHLLPKPQLCFDLLGVEHISCFNGFFDTVLCLGVAYHRKDPYTTCRMLYDCLKPGGQLLFETLVIPGEEAMCLCPEDRYAKMRNVWWVPTCRATEIWLEKAGFSEIKLCDVTKTEPSEQRATEWAPFESLPDFLDPVDPEKTVEGYPAPSRALFSAWKPG